MQDHEKKLNLKVLLFQIGEAISTISKLGKRSWLALLGIAIGCAAVVALINIGHSAANESLKNFNDLGSSLIVGTFPPDEGKYPMGPSILDTETILTHAPLIESLAPIILQPITISNFGQSIEATIVGTTSDLKKILGIKLVAGRFISNFDSKTTYAVVGSDIAYELSKKSSSTVIGSRIVIGGYIFSVIGISRPATINPLLPISVNNSVFIPMASMNRLGGTGEISNVIVKAKTGANLLNAAEQISLSTNNSTRGRASHYQIPQLLIEGIKKQANMFSYLLIGLGSISLLVGGIGVMNVMLMNVLARRREIGVRIAIGAKPNDIKVMFLLEAAVLSMTGSVGGAAVGVVAAYIFARFSGWEFSLSRISIPLGITSSILIGLFFGISPAMTAAKLNPVEALRDE